MPHQQLLSKRFKSFATFSPLNAGFLAAELLVDWSLYTVCLSRSTQEELVQQHKLKA